MDDGTFDEATDGAMLQASRAGDREALSRLLRGLQDPWYRMCLSLLGDPDLARDATQETAVRFLRQLAGFRGESQLRTWSLGIALNVVREMRRHGSRRSAGGEEGLDDVPTGARRLGRPADPAPDGRAELAERRDRVRAVLADLPERQREAVLLRFFEDLSVEETADAMGCAAGTVKATVHQALRSLKQRLRQLA